jgi:hypothetical protein
MLSKGFDQFEERNSHVVFEGAQVVKRDVVLDVVSQGGNFPPQFPVC